jgi:hypothetical protein
MKTKIQIKTIGGSLLFEYEAEGNTTKKTVEQAVSSGADLSRADLSEAYLSGADLSGAYLSRAYLSRADLSRAYLSGADLSGAYLSRADLSGAEFKNIGEVPKQWLNLVTRDMLWVFRALKPELPEFRKRLIKGKIDGTQYEGDCACLIGTMAKLDGGLDQVCKAIPYYDRGLHNPGEQWFFGIRKGDKPKDNLYAAYALKLVDMVLEEE